METLTFLLTSTFYPPYHVGGDAVHVKHLAEELTKKGHEVHVLHSIDASRLKRIAPEPTSDPHGVHIHGIETPFRLSAYAAYLLGNSSAVYKRFRRLVQVVVPDVVHHHNISLLGYGILNRRASYLNLYTAHDYWLFCQRNNLMEFGRFPCTERHCTSCSFAVGRPPQMWRMRSEFCKAIHEIDHIIAPSKFMLNALKQEFPDIRMHHIPNFVFPMNSGAASNDANRERSCSDHPYFVYVGVLERHKGIMPFLRRFVTWSLQREVELRIVGTGSLESNIDRFVRNQKSEDRICMLGRVSSGELRRQISGAIGLVLPSVWPENSPLVALEALAAGTPPISSSLGGLPEIVGLLDRRLLFQWHEPDSLEQALDYAIERHGALGARAKCVFNTFFSSEKYLELYDRLL